MPTTTFGSLLAYASSNPDTLPSSVPVAPYVGIASTDDAVQDTPKGEGFDPCAANEHSDWLALMAYCASGDWK